jgi:hypothetical protein
MAILASVFVLGCQPQVNQSEPTSSTTPAPTETSQQEAEPEPAPGLGCTAPGPQTGAMLPLFNGSTQKTDITRIRKNLCVSVVDLVAQVTPYAAEIEKLDQKVKLKAFINKVDRVGGALGTFAATAECAYQTDRLAIGIYQHDNYPWSLAVVAVVRGGVDAAGDVAACYFFGPSGTPNAAPPDNRQQQGPILEIDADIASQVRNGEHFTVFWVSSSDWMSETLHAKFRARQ